MTNSRVQVDLMPHRPVGAAERLDLLCPPVSSLLYTQSYNTAVNFNNRSGSAVDTKQILTSYALAVATSCSLAAGLGKVGRTLVTTRLLVRPIDSRVLDWCPTALPLRRSWRRGTSEG